MNISLTYCFCTRVIKLQVKNSTKAEIVGENKVNDPFEMGSMAYYLLNRPFLIVWRKGNNVACTVKKTQNVNIDVRLCKILDRIFYLRVL